MTPTAVMEREDAIPEAAPDRKTGYLLPKRATYYGFGIGMTFDFHTRLTSKGLMAIFDGIATKDKDGNRIPGTFPSGLCGNSFGSHSSESLRAYLANKGVDNIEGFMHCVEAKAYHRSDLSRI